MAECLDYVRFPAALVAEIARRQPGNDDRVNALCMDLICHDGPHLAPLFAVGGRRAATVWVRWSRAAAPELVELADCREPHAGGACPLYAGHDPDAAP
ncbi:hypothetical protein SUDANB120_02566 [Streptomyces sp. enrichment culture]|uniref:hypothetical protein n=1 Tax=Streptomyces TaxID=1883 RepID=UPI00167B6DBD|nr:MULTISPECIES: hypothetical protein [Streptomyces]MBD3580739.1 hypothetical protein [Streptomyces sp. KD18]GGT08271.1 hypothetical protein GCM10010286_36990 [Streptomyces toxytricini]